jgi:FKBP-type peptidyl-prolyl cis-trans isomerase SlyD
MNITKDAVAAIRYRLLTPGGEELETSGDEPAWYLHGADNLLPGLETALEGKAAGDALTVDLEPDDAFGAYDEELVTRVARTEIDLPQDQLVPGTELQLEHDEGVAVVTITEADDEALTLDGNHPLAGRTVRFEVEVLEVRAATEDELAHGHAHGPDGHHDEHA